MENTGRFVFKVPEDFNSNYCNSQACRTLMEENPDIYMSTLFLPDTIVTDNVTEKQYLTLARSVYGYAEDHGIPYEDVLLVEEPDFRRGYSLEEEEKDDLLLIFEESRGDIYTQEARDMPIEDAFPEPWEYVFNGKIKECVPPRIKRLLGHNSNDDISPRDITDFFHDHSVELFMQKNLHMSPGSRKTFHIYGELSDTEKMGKSTNVSCTGKYKTILNCLKNDMDIVKYGLRKKRIVFR